MTQADLTSHSQDSFAAGDVRSGDTRSSKTRLVIGAVVVLLVLAVAAGAFFVFFGDSSGSNDLLVATSPAAPEAAVAQSAPTAAPTSSEVTITPVEPPEVPLTEVFTFRDIFEPLAKAPATTSTGSTSGGTPTGGGSGTTTETSANTILLQDITSENGEPMAVLVWNGTTYTVGEGEQVDGSPWEVLDIGTDSVVMLYGDVQVPLSIGQAITK